MKILSLFSGTKSITKELKEHEVISVDMDNTFSPTHHVDIMKFDYKKYDPNFFGAVWASPPCVWYSQLQYGWLNRVRNVNGVKKKFTREVMEEQMQNSDKLVEKVFEIIKYFNAPYFMENPYTSRLKKREVMIAPFKNVCSYCKYDFPYQKRTIIYSNKKLSLFDCKRDCGKIVNGLHTNNIGSTRCRLKMRAIDGEKYGKCYNQHQRWRVPPKLIRHIFSQL